ncbi:winged helix-turn-helix domain-containing protein [Falsiroseomonas oryzae]|uniref:winged helix-turn-helix domain-containing protein n=1 Tax=Falsiroseomonas oryzae TaxID=2766473 RepID=UPI0022EB2CA0|nr:winged helix-turn-helix domain-containing protein [Roseomonas sp. MO-31]
MEIRATARRIRFGHCTLDEGRGMLLAPDGTETLLRPKTYELLRLLLRNPGRVVARDEILDAVWPGIFVTDDSITQCVVEIRKAIGAGGTELLKTVPRRGYLLQAEVETDELVAAPVAPLLSPRADDRPSIAVLPFRKDHHDPEEGWFADGIIEGIVHVLSGLDGLFVVSRGSALAFAARTLDARAAGRELGVRYVLYGGVRRAGGRVRISTELTDAERGTILRTDRFDGEANDIFALQDRVAEQVVAAIAPQLREHELQRALRKPPANLTAYDLVLRALDEIRRMDRAALDRGRALLGQAMEADPDSALPFSYTAWWHSLRIAQGWAEEPGETQAARDCAEAALRRDRHDAFALALRGFLHGYMEHDFATARRMLDQAVDVGPSCALAWSWGGALRCWLDEGADAVAWASRGLRLAPCDPFTFLHEHILAQARYTAGEMEQAVAAAHASMLSNPQHLANWRTLIASLVALGRMDEARRFALRLMELDPGFSLGGFLRRTPLQGGMRDLFAERLRRAGLPD